MTSGEASVVAVFGLGTMGGRIAEKLLGSGRRVVGFDPALVAQERAREHGVQVCDHAADAVRAAEVVLLSLPFPRDVCETVAGPLMSAKPGTTVVDMSTIDPGTAKDASRRLQDRQVDYLDAPVLGRPQNCGHWTLPAGGSSDAVMRVTGLLEGTVAKSVAHVGDVGTGSVIKLLNNLMFGAINAAIAECIATCNAAGLDTDIFIDTIARSGAATVSNLFVESAPRLARKDFSATFALNLLRKDNRLALRYIEDLGLLPILGRTIDTINTLAVNAGRGGDDASAVYAVYDVGDMPKGS